MNEGKSTRSRRVGWERGVRGIARLGRGARHGPHVCCTSDTIDIGLYEPAHLLGPTLLFEVDDLSKALGRLGAIDVAPAGRAPVSPRQMRAAVLLAPEGTPILLAAAPGG